MESNARELFDQLVNRKKYLESMLQNAMTQKGKLNVIPSHKIRVHKHGNRYQYYVRSDKKDTSGTYIKKNQEGEIQQILQSEYLQKTIEIVQKEISIINKYLSNAAPNKLADYYENMNKGRKLLIDPLEVDDDTYEKIWLSVPYQGKGFLSDIPEYYTQKMRRVRSKSEIIIANTLDNFHIPYRYEYPILVKGMGKIYPDFTVLNTRTRKEIYWEHFGLMDDDEYREKAMRKVALYEESNIYVGDKLIVTCESLKQPLNMKDLERKIKKYLL